MSSKIHFGGREASIQTMIQIQVAIREPAPSWFSQNYFDVVVHEARGNVIVALRYYSEITYKTGT